MEKKQPVLAPQATKTFRKPYRHDERKEVLRGAGLPDDVHPYHIDESDSGIIAGGNNTATVRSIIQNAFSFAAEQCTRYKVSDPGRAFNRYPAFRETSFDVFEPVFSAGIEQCLPASQLAERLEYADRMSRPEIETFAPADIMPPTASKTGRPNNPADTIERVRALHLAMPWKDVAATISKETGREYSTHACRAMLRAKRAK